VTDATDRKRLEASWLDLTRRRLPQAATVRRWPIRHDHCFQRVLLDNACGGVWYDHIDGRPAYRAAPLRVLAAAVALAEDAEAGRADLPALNAASLGWRAERGRRPRPRRRDASAPRAGRDDMAGGKGVSGDGP
jgi:hypothetical protein